MSKVAGVLARVLVEAPGSIRELADAAGLDPSSLTRARDEEFELTAIRVQALISALRLWSRKCAELANKLETALERDAPEAARSDQK